MCTPTNTRYKELKLKGFRFWYVNVCYSRIGGHTLDREKSAQQQKQDTEEDGHKRMDWIEDHCSSSCRQAMRVATQFAPAPASLTIISCRHENRQIYH